MEEGRSAFKILTGKPTAKRFQESLGVDGRTILEWLLKKYVSRRGIGLIRLRILESPCECGIQLPGAVSRGVIRNHYIRCCHSITLTTIIIIIIIIYHNHY